MIDKIVLYEKKGKIFSHRLIFLKEYIFTCKSRFTSLSMISFVLGAYVLLLPKSFLFSTIDLNPTFSDIP